MVFRELDANARRLSTLWVNQAQVRDVNRSLLLDDASLGILGRRLRALGNDVDTFHDGTILRNQNLQHLTSLALVFSGEDIDRIVLSDV